jgi:hypothetical protein
VHSVVTTALDVVGLLAVSAGVFFACAPALGGAALAPAGVTVLAGSAAAAWRARPRPEQQP